VRKHILQSSKKKKGGKRPGNGRGARGGKLAKEKPTKVDEEVSGAGPAQEDPGGRLAKD